MNKLTKFLWIALAVIIALVITVEFIIPLVAIALKILLGCGLVIAFFYVIFRIIRYEMKKPQNP